MATISKILGALRKGTGTVLKDTFRSNHEVVRSTDDLPDPETVTIDGSDKTVIPLESSVEYEIDGVVNHDFPILGNSQSLYGKNSGGDLLVYTGTDSQLIYRDDDFFIESLLFMQSGGGDWLDLSASNTAEFLARSVAVVSGGSWGVVEGYRVPVFEFCSFDNISDGITFDGSPNKIFLIGCAIRNMADGGSGIILSDTLDVEFVDISKGFLKDFGANTTGLDDRGANVSDFGIVSGNLFEDSVTNKTSGVDETTVGWQFSENNGIQDSTVRGQYSKDATTTTTINSQAGSKTDEAAYEKISGSTTLGDGASRVSQPSENTFQYDGDAEVEAEISASVTASGVNDKVAIAVFKNQSLVSISAMTITLQGSTSVNVTTYAETSVVSGDAIEVYIANLGSTSDVTIEDMIVSIGL